MVAAVQVTTLLNSVDEVQRQPQRTEADLQLLREQAAEQGLTVKAAKAVRIIPTPVLLLCGQVNESPVKFRVKSN